MGFNYVRLLENITKNDFFLVGGKGANLGEMIKAELPVPGGFVVLTTGYQKFIEDNNLDKNILDAIKNLDVNNLEKLENISKKIKSMFKKGTIPVDIIKEIDEAYEILDNAEVAVRSSSTAEDLPGTSFAGQYDTYLNIKGKEELYKSIINCWASLWNSRAISYRVDQSIVHKGIGHGVVVQKLIKSEKSGILFTANPVNGRRDQILINSSWGLGEAIVGGEVTPDQWVVNKKNGEIIEEIIAQKEIMTIRKDKGIENREVIKERQREATLNKHEVEQLLQMAIKVENYFGLPQDIEWAYENEQFYLVQSRPITSLYQMPKIRNDKNDLRIYININNYSQAMKEPFTPMGENIIRAMVDGLATRLGKKGRKKEGLWWYQVIGGRIFFDITDFVRTEKSWDKFKKNDPMDKDPITTKALLQLLERNREEIINPKEAVNYLKIINIRLIKFLIDGVIKYCYGIFSPVKAREKAISLGDRIIKDLKNKSKNLKTVEDKLRFIEENCSTLFIEGFGIIFYVAVSSTYIEKAKEIMKRYLENTTDLYYVEKSIPYSVTTEMGMEILKLAKYFDQIKEKPNLQDKRLLEFLEKYGHRNTIELDVGIPGWKEEPQYVLDLINSYIETKNYQEAIDRFYLGQEEAETAIERIKKSLEEKGQHKKGKKVEKMLKDFREMFGIREQSKFFVRQFLSVFREVLTEVGEELMNNGKLEEKLDIFYVTIDDIRTNKNLREIALLNKEQYLRDLKRAAPRLLTSTGESIYSAVEDIGKDHLTGIPVSPGIHEGRVKILMTPEEGHKLEKGDILVTTGTNPAWTPLFLKLGGLIMETGGPISHGSVVAREYGLPAVAGVAKATTLLKEGQIVRINGETGKVEITGSQI